MTQNIELTPLIQAIKDNRDAVLRRKDIPQRDRIYNEAFVRFADESREMQFAKGFANFLSEKAILIQRHDLLAGYSFHYAYASTYPAVSDQDFDPARGSSFSMDVQKETNETISCLSLPADGRAARQLRAFADGVDSYVYKHWHSGHVIPGYQQLLQEGFGGILKREKAALEKAAGKQKDSIEAFIIVTEAAIKYIRRYEALAAEMMAGCEDAEQKTRLLRIRECCRSIADGIPQTFFEALQLLWFGHELITAESTPTSTSIGRIDAYLSSFYAQDISAGRLSRAEAGELIDAFWLKCSVHRQQFQNIALGGTDAAGNPSANPVTQLCLESTARLRMDQPSVSFLWADGMPAEMWPSVLDLIKTGTGFPAIFSDRSCLKARRYSGVAEEDLHRYGIIGCVEFGQPGEDYCITEMCRLNLPKLFELMFNQGHDKISGRHFPMGTDKTIAGVSSYEEFYDWYMQEMEHFARLGLESTQKIDAMYGLRYPLPFLSTLMPHCIETGTDVSSGGAKYNSTGFNMGGTATAADSLIAIKKAVYDEHIVSLEEFARALGSNFEGYEDLLSYVSSRSPKFGNDIEEVDSVAEDLIGRFIDIAESYETPRGGRYRVGLHTVQDHSRMGMQTGATPDGRLAGKALSNSLGPVQGKDTQGPTALANSVSKIDSKRFTNGMVLDLKFTPSFLEKESHAQALKYLIETYFKRGGMEIQISVISRDTLIAAQKNPAEYKDLVVRVSGFSAYFHALPKATQDEIILRTEHKAC